MSVKENKRRLIWFWAIPLLLLLLFGFAIFQTPTVKSSRKGSHTVAASPLVAKVNYFLSDLGVRTHLVKHSIFVVKWNTDCNDCHR